MLPKQYRLKKRSAFNATYKVKNSVHKSGITLFAGKEKNIAKRNRQLIELKYN